MNQLTTATKHQVTISSVDLVAIINGMREADKAELRHDTFIVKIKNVLGDGHQNFLASYLNSQNKKQPCYQLPKREASLMVMSESYAVQAQVYDRLALLETPASKPSVPKITSPSSNSLSMFKEGYSVAKLIGLTGNMAILAADKVAITTTGISTLGLLGQLHLTADKRGMTYTPTELGRMLHTQLSAIAMNKMLESMGCQFRDREGYWQPTVKAKGMYEWLDTGKKNGIGTPIKQLKWFDEVLNFSLV